MFLSGEVAKMGSVRAVHRRLGHPGLRLAAEGRPHRELGPVRPVEQAARARLAGPGVPDARRHPGHHGDAGRRAQRTVHGPGPLVPGRPQAVRRVSGGAERSAAPRKQGAAKPSPTENAESVGGNTGGVHAERSRRMGVVGTRRQFGHNLWTRGRRWFTFCPTRPQFVCRKVDLFGKLEESGDCHRKYCCLGLPFGSSSFLVRGSEKHSSPDPCRGA